MTLEEAARRSEVSHTFVKGLIRRGVLPARQVVQYAPWVIEEKALESAAVKAAIHRILKGARNPADLPVRAADQVEIELVINLKTAKAVNATAFDKPRSSLGE